MFSEFLILFFPGLSPRTATWNTEPRVGFSAVWHSLNAAGSRQVSYKHLVHMSWSDFPLLTPAAAVSCSLQDPLSPPATFPQSNLTHSPASACNVDFPKLTEEPCICSYQQVYFRFLHFLMKITLADWCCRWRPLMKALTTPKPRPGPVWGLSMGSCPFPSHLCSHIATHSPRPHFSITNKNSRISCGNGIKLLWKSRFSTSCLSYVIQHRNPQVENLVDSALSWWPKLSISGLLSLLSCCVT